MMLTSSSIYPAYRKVTTEFSGNFEFEGVQKFVGHLETEKPAREKANGGYRDRHIQYIDYFTIWVDKYVFIMSGTIYIRQAYSSTYLDKRVEGSIHDKHSFINMFIMFINMFINKFINCHY